MEAGRTVAHWTLSRLLGRGGSAEVWVAHDNTGREVALKILAQKRYTDRFRDEITLYRELGARIGILPLVDSYLRSDNEATAGPEWLAMEVGTSVAAYLGTERTLTEVVKAIKSYGDTLVSLEAERIWHRDIKPSNLYWYNGGYAIGDFGIADFPDKAGLTKTGERLGPANFLAPEMIEHSGDVLSGPADVYSLAKTLFALAAGRSFPPPGELRRDREELRLSTVSADHRAYMLESLLERATSNDPSLRPTMAEFADELSWWGEPQVIPQVDLSTFADEVKRLRTATETVPQESEQQRRGRLYNDAGNRVQQEVTVRLQKMMESIGLKQIRSVSRPLEGWPPLEYGGSVSLPCWGVETLVSPWLAGSIGVVHRANTEDDLDDLMITVLLARVTLDTQHEYLRLSRPFRSGSMGLDKVIEEVNAEIDSRLPEMVADFLSECRQNGVPRRHPS